MKSPPMDERIRDLRRRARRLVALHGLSCVVAIVVAVVIVLGAADFAIRLRDPGLRVICSLAAFGVLAAASYRFLVVPLRARLSDVDLAKRVERRFPGLEDRLVSSVQFMRESEDDPLAGSGALRRAVIAEAAAATDGLDFLAVLNRRRPIRVATVAVVVCLVGGLLAALAPGASATAVLRLAYPFGVAWPQRTHLEVRPPVARAAKGRPLEIRVVDAEGKKLPADVTLFVRIDEADGSVSEQVEPMRPAGDAMIAALEPARSFSYRVAGGDDDSMPWLAVEVVDPPGLESVRVELIPPQYTGWPARVVEGGRIRALEGTSVRISGKANRPLDSAFLRWADGAAVEAAVEVGPSDLRGQAVGAAVVLPGPTEDEAPRTLVMALTDQEGLEGETVWEITVVGDRPPTASIARPSDTVYVMAEGVVPLEVTAADDLALGGVELAYGRPPDSAEETPEDDWSEISLYRGPASVEAAGGGSLQGVEPADRRTIEFRWELAELGLTPGTELSFRVAARDYRPQERLSEPRRLVVITLEQLQQRLADRQAVIVAELGRVLTMQRGSRTQVESLAIRLAETGRLAQRDVDRLQGAELNQRDVGTSLTSRTAGVPMHVLALLADLDNNRLDSPDLRRRMDSLLEQIGRLEREHLALIGRELTAAIKSAQTELARPSESSETAEGQGPVAASLAEAGSHQDQVIATLEAVLDELAEWDRYRRFHREISQLLREEVELTERSEDVGRRTLGKELKDLLPQEAADLKILGGQQLELARQFDRILQQMDRAAEELAPSDPLAAETLADALAEARRLGISPRMLAAGGQLKDNQTGQATAEQRRIAEDLQDVLDILANRREHELERLRKKLEEAEADLDDIARREAEARQRAEATRRASDDAERRRELKRLAEEQARLAEETERLARRLERLMAEKAASSAAQAAGAMGQSGGAAGQGDSQGASQAAAAAEEALQRAKEELAAKRREAEAELAGEQLARLEDHVEHLRRRQQGMLEETRRLDGLWVDGQLTRAQAASLRDLAGLQQAIQRETGDLAEKLGGVGAFAWTLSRVASSMGEAGGLLARQQTAEPTQEAEQEAIARLDLVIEALKKDPPGGSDGGGGSGGEGQGGQPGAQQVLAQLKLLKLLQEVVNAQTAELQEAIEAGHTLTDSQRRRYAALGEEQGRLADLAMQLMATQPVDLSDAPEEAPEQGAETREERELGPDDGSL